MRRRFISFPRFSPFPPPRTVDRSNVFDVSSPSSSSSSSSIDLVPRPQKYQLSGRGIFINRLFLLPFDKFISRPRVQFKFDFATSMMMALIKIFLSFADIGAR